MTNKWFATVEHDSSGINNYMELPREISSSVLGLYLLYPEMPF